MKTIILFILIISHIVIAQTTGFVKINIETDLGNIVAELYQDKAPITVNNILEYIDSGYYSYGAFIRTVTDENQPDNKVKINVIQCDAHPWFANALDPIFHETTKTTGIKHEDGTLSMARYTPGTATSSFFICVGPQPELDFGGKRNPDEQGFAAFGKIISGLDVITKINQSNNFNQTLMPPIRIISITRINK
jgi:peptidyl-prolyl cis-trans isomerase A (cyclophilin A)